MSLDPLSTLDIIEVMENFIDRNRPEEMIRKELDIAYKIEDQSIIIYEIRPFYLNPEEIIESPFAKATYVKKKELWKVFWQRADLKWHPYDPKPIVKTLNSFIKLVEDDTYGCFRG